MARGDSTIRVSIIGDARKLTGALGDADRATGGLLKSAATVAVAGAVIKEGFDFVGDALDNADRLGDATSRLELSIGKVDADKIAALADEFTDVGLAAPAVAEISASFAEMAKASTDLNSGEIAAMAPGVAEFAGALARVKDADPAAMGEAVSKFISGARGAKQAGIELGIPFDEALTPGQRYAELMERLPALVDQVTGANAGLDDKQSKLEATWDNFTTKVGPSVEAGIEGILDWTTDMVDAIPGAIEGWDMLGRHIQGALNDILSPLARASDAVQGFLNLVSQIPRTGNDPLGDFIFGERGVTEAQQRERARNGQGAR